jgi:hypothetical protein
MRRVAKEGGVCISLNWEGGPGYVRFYPKEVSSGIKDERKKAMKAKQLT